MAFTKVGALTINESIALARVHFADNRFSIREFAIYLSSLLGDRLTVSTFEVVRDLVDTAVREGMLQAAPSERFKIPALAVELLDEVDLPGELFTRLDKLDGERTADANADAGPVLRELLDTIPRHKAECQHELKFVNSVFSHWRDRGWLSSKQVDKIKHIGSRHGMFIAAHHYIGRAMDEWRQPYRDAEARKLAATYARESVERSVFQAQSQQTQVRTAVAVRNPKQSREAALTHNRQIKVELEGMEREGALDQLEKLVDAIFPESTLSKRTRVAAYTGAGSKELRVCIATLAFGKPPALVWKQSGQMTQPTAQSEQWQALRTHPALIAFKLQFDV